MQCNLLRRIHESEMVLVTAVPAKGQIDSKVDLYSEGKSLGISNKLLVSLCISCTLIHLLLLGCFDSIPLNHSKEKGKILVLACNPQCIHTYVHGGICWM